MTKKIMIVAFITVALFLGSMSTAFSTDPTDLRYMTEVYPPFNFVEKSELKGIAVDFLKEVWAEMGVNEQNIEVLPWARAYNLAQKEKNTVLFSTTRSAARESLFKWAGPIKSNPIGFVARKDAHITADSIAKIKKYRLGTVRDDFCEDVLQQKGFDIESLERVSSLSANLKKLANKRIDMIVNSVEGTFIALEKEGYNVDEFMVVGILSDVPLSYAFHKDVPQELVDSFQKAIESLEGKRKELLKKYCVNEQKRELLQ
jgi:polar amino acid transport system substrate-binding protein